MCIDGDLLGIILYRNNDGFLVDARCSNDGSASGGRLNNHRQRCVSGRRRCGEVPMKSCVLLGQSTVADSEVVGCRWTVVQPIDATGVTVEISSVEEATSASV